MTSNEQIARFFSCHQHYCLQHSIDSKNCIKFSKDAKRLGFIWYNGNNSHYQIRKFQFE
jgi:hypothetical protein